MFRWLAAAGVALLSLAGAQAAPLEAYGRLPTIEHPDISPDGSKIAYDTPTDTGTTVFVMSLADHKAIGGVNVGTQKLRDVRWAGDNYILVTTSVTAHGIGVRSKLHENLLVQSFNIATHEQKPLLQHNSDAMNIALAYPITRTIDGHAVVMIEGVGFVSHVGVDTLFAVDLDADRTRVASLGDEDTEGWAVDENGNVVAQFAYDDKTQHWSIRLLKALQWRDTYSIAAPIETPSYLGLGPDGTTLVINELDDGEWVNKQIRLADGTVAGPLDLGSGDTRIVQDPRTHRLIGVEHVGAHISYTFFDRADLSAWKTLTSPFDGEDVALVSWSDDRKQVIVQVDGASDGSSYYLIDQNKHMATPMGPLYHDIAPEDVAPKRFITYRAADGTTIPAYLTLPAGRTAKNLPLAVLVHGGPAARDDPQFDWWSQALAAQGYAVLQPEFRGSDGFGWRLLSAGFGQWGRKMQSDVSDGVRSLAGQGTIDPGRVCIVGASYGGYAALAGATMEHGIYRCAVSVSGVADPAGMIRWDFEHRRSEETRSFRYLTRFMGAEDASDARLTEISPLAHAASASAPILLIHGTDDTVVPIGQSEDMTRALQAAGKPVSFVKLPGEDHWLSRADTRLKMLQATVAFLQQNNPSN